MKLIDADELKNNIPETNADVFENCRYCKLLDAEQVKDIIDSSPTVGINECNMWIPISQKFPQIGKIVLFCTNTGAIEKGWSKGYNGFHEVWSTDEGFTFWDDEVVAWMDLPRPFNKE